MSKHAHKFKILVGCITLLIVLALLSFEPAIMADMQIEQNSLRTLLEQLLEENRSFAIAFIQPIWEGRNLWSFPDTSPSSIEPEFTNINRIVSVSDDHFCIEQIGYGATDYLCIPYNNISFIHYN
jgi:hypothetical protein